MWHVVRWLWDGTGGRLLCKIGLHAWHDCGVGRTPRCRRCLPET